MNCGREREMGRREARKDFALCVWCWCCDVGVGRFKRLGLRKANCPEAEASRPMDTVSGSGYERGCGAQAARTKSGRNERVKAFPSHEHGPIARSAENGR